MERASETTEPEIPSKVDPAQLARVFEVLREGSSFQMHRREIPGVEKEPIKFSLTGTHVCLFALSSFYIIVFVLWMLSPKAYSQTWIAVLGQAIAFFPLGKSMKQPDRRDGMMG